jgi:hypothetical protein
MNKLRNFASNLRLNRNKGDKREMKKILLIAVVLAGFAFASASSSQAGVSVGIGIGLPVAYGYGCYPYGYGYPYAYGYRPVVYAGPSFYWSHGHRVYYHHPRVIRHRIRR